ncbi:complement C1q-like protein 4 [Ostrea edulis]|uniref:complement C1q-like protein 4 n=1 Tax=Ostrea edulis TaxID=37623 RepID=UPI0024AF18D8|nr:complement C1q-like protein 4 [Ostrea edulis]XP_048742175.2 complement C1q-like protein 4 [Ostrea edulis]
MKCTYIKELLWLLFSIYAAVNGDCNKGITLIKGQLKALEKSVNMVDGSSCFSPKPKMPVAFHAEVSSDKTYKAGSPWVFDKVVTNVGNAYNSTTGKFTTPSKSIYLFNWYTLGYPGEMAHAGLYVNGKIKGRQATNNIGNEGKYITSGSSIVLALEKGDLVYIMDAHGITSKVKGRWTAFGGVQQN